MRRFRAALRGSTAQQLTEATAVDPVGAAEFGGQDGEPASYSALHRENGSVNPGRQYNTSSLDCHDQGRNSLDTKIVAIRKVFINLMNQNCHWNPQAPQNGSI
jgi:hypothetical protein